MAYFSLPTAEKCLTKKSFTKVLCLRQNGIGHGLHEFPRINTIVFICVNLCNPWLTFYLPSAEKCLNGQPFLFVNFAKKITWLK